MNRKKLTFKGLGHQTLHVLSNNWPHIHTSCFSEIVPHTLYVYTTTIFVVQHKKHGNSSCFIRAAPYNLSNIPYTQDICQIKNKKNVLFLLCSSPKRSYLRCFNYKRKKMGANYQLPNLELNIWIGAEVLTPNAPEQLRPICSLIADFSWFFLPTGIGCKINANQPAY